MSTTEKKPRFRLARGPRPDMHFIEFDGHFIGATPSTWLGGAIIHALNNSPEATMAIDIFWSSNTPAEDTTKVEANDETHH